MAKPGGLKPQDVLVICKLFSLSEFPRKGSDFTLASLGSELKLSTSEIHNSLGRCREAKLLIKNKHGESVSKGNFLELVLYAIPRIFFVERGPVERGLLTGASAPQLLPTFKSIADDVKMVWQYEPEDQDEEWQEKFLARGETIVPIYPTVPAATAEDVHLHEILSLVEVIRLGAKESKEKASNILEKRIIGKGK